MVCEVLTMRLNGRRQRVFITVTFLLMEIGLTGSATITVPTAGNCGDDTVLTCQVTGSIVNLYWTGLGRSLVLNGIPARPEDNNKYTQSNGTSSFTLTIHNTDLTDEGGYKCGNGFNESQLKRLNIECKASTANLSITSGKKVSITIDKLYPASPVFSVTFKENTDVMIPGSGTCSNSTQYSGYYRCTWSSSNSLADRSYNYSVVVKTITQADPLTGFFKIASPNPPVILNTTTLDDSRVVLFGNGGQMLTIQCTSTGGYPSPTVAWYKDSVSASNQLASTSTGTLQNDGTYTVTLSHTFTPTLSDDKKTLICRSYYPQADSAYRGSENTTAMLYLRLQPSQPTVTQVSDVSSGGTVEVRCTTTGSRPAATITWSYQGSTSTGQDSTTKNNSTETYTVTSVFRRQVTAADNGREVQCIVTHPALVSPSEKTASVKLNVQFSVQASTTVITGNKVMTATGTATLTLTCTTGSSNPASDITWKNGSTPLNSNRPYTNSSGENNGVVRSQQLVLTPTRYMDGDVLTCSVSNRVSQAPVTYTATLDLRYRPLINAMQDIVAVEGSKTELPCSASSKPASTFTWYRGQSGLIYQGSGTLENNQLTYKFDRVNRADAGTYRCNANNGIETADEKSVSLIVHYPPVVSVVTTNTSVTAISVSLICSASGVPNTSYAYGTWIQTWPGQSGTLKEYPGSRKLELKNLTYEHSGVYKCSASNGIKVFGTDKEYIEGSAQLVVKSYPLIVRVPEIVSARLNENVTMHMDYFSNTAGSRVSISKNVNGSRENIINFIISETTTEVNLPVFEYSIKTSGTRAFITMKIESKEDFGLYDVVLSNEINSTFRTVEIIPKGPPGKPSNLSVDENMYKAVSLSWLRGYHGGLAQTFVVEVSTDLKKWRNVSSIYDGKKENAQPVSITLTGLQDSTTYFLHVYAYNDEGISPYTDNVNFTTIAGEDDKNPVSSALIGGVAGGSSAVLVIIAIVVLVTLMRKGFFSKGNSKKQDKKDDRKPVYKDEDDYGMQDNPMYVSAGPRNEAQSASKNTSDGSAAVYSTVDKTKPAVSGAGNDVYAEVDKTKKKQGKPKKSKLGILKDKKGKKHTQEGDIYENASTTELKVKKTNDDAIYENPEPTKKSGKKNVNKDGLIYADLAFNDQPKGQKKLIIHGIEDFTEYVTVDFTKKADPLPDSDDENSTPKK